MRRLLWALRSMARTSAMKGVSLAKRRRRIKLAADISLALTCNGTLWSHALIARISKIDKHRSLLHSIISRRKLRDMIMEQNKRTQKQKPSLSGSRRAMKLRYMKTPRRCNMASSYEVARSLVSQRTKQLKSLIPGGESMDNLSLLKEAADYIVSLRTQVEVMKSLAHHSTIDKMLSDHIHTI